MVEAIFFQILLALAGGQIVIHPVFNVAFFVQALLYLFGANLSIDNRAGVDVVMVLGRIVFILAGEGHADFLFSTTRLDGTLCNDGHFHVIQRVPGHGHRCGSPKMNALQDTLVSILIEFQDIIVIVIQSVESDFRPSGKLGDPGVTFTQADGQIRLLDFLVILGEPDCTKQECQQSQYFFHC